MGQPRGADLRREAAQHGGRGELALVAENDRLHTQFCYNFWCLLNLSRLENFDLHNHSTRSDGLLSPTQLIELASRNGVDAIALTDHDTTDGLDEAAGAAREHGVALVAGVEISVDWGGTTLHVVGLGIDPRAAALDEGLREIRRGRWQRAERIAAALAKLG